MTLDKSVKDRLVADICEWMDEFIKKQMTVALSDVHDAQSDANAKPFHKELLPRSFLRTSSIERSFSTMLGKSYERHSGIIAESRFAEVHLQHKTEGTLLEAVDTEISDEVGRINKGKIFDNYHVAIEKILEMERQGSGNQVTRAVTSDVYLKDRAGNETFFEIKTPKPNKEQCLNITRKHLWIHAILKKPPPKVTTYYGMGYNPYGEGNEYKHSFSISHLDIGRQTLIGKAFWDFLGGDGTYEELLEIYHGVGRSKAKEIQEMLSI